MSTRNVEGTIRDLVTPWANQTLTFRLMTPIASVDAFYAATTIQTTTDSNGDFVIALPVPDGATQAAPYLVVLPTNLTLPFVLSRGTGAAQIDSLLVQALPNVSPNGLQVLIDLHAAIEADDGTLGHVDYDSTAFAAAVAAHGGGGGGGGGAPSGPAGGVLSGTYPNPGFAVDMATQAELNTEAATRATADTTNTTNLATHAALTTAAHGGIVASADSRLSDARAPTGPAGGVLGGTYPNPSFAVDMATQTELDAEASTRASADTALNNALLLRLLTSDFTWSNLPGKPSTFAPSAHASTHASTGSDPLTLSEDQITNLTTDLAGKVPTGRTLTINGDVFDLSADRSWTVSGGGSPGGSDTQVQFNDGSALGGAASLTYDDVTNATILQGQANHTPTLGSQLLENRLFEFDSTGWSGTGWNWSPFTLTHDIAYTDSLSTDATVANAGEYLLILLTISGQTQGALQISVGLAPDNSNPQSFTIVTGDGSHAIVLRAGVDGAYLFFTPQADGYAAVFDGALGYLSVKAITIADAVLLSKREDASDGSLQVILGEGGSLFFGQRAGSACGPDAFANLGIGPDAMRLVPRGYNNVAIGSAALAVGANARDNLAIGPDAMHYAQEAVQNVAIGSGALYLGYAATQNTAIGAAALGAAADASQNIAIGVFAGSHLIHGIGNVLVGYNSGSDLADASYQLRISHPVAGEPLIAGDFQAQTVTIGGDLDFTDDAKGIILIDRADATRWRLTVTSGVLSVELA